MRKIGHIQRREEYFVGEKDTLEIEEEGEVDHS